jgi:hypothetical protein
MNEHSLPESQPKRKRRQVSRKTITFCEQRAIYLALLHLQDAIEEGDAEKAEGLRREIMQELPIGEDAIEQSHNIYQIELQQERIRRPFEKLTDAEQIAELASLWN